MISKRLTPVRAGQLAQVARQGAIVFVALALPRLGLSTAVIGQWEALLFLGYLLGFGWLTGLLQAFLVTVAEAPPAAAFAERALGTILLFSAALLGLAALVHPWLFGLLRFDLEAVAWPAFFLFLLARWPGFCFEQVLLVRGRSAALVAFALLNAAGTVGALLLPLYYGGGLNDGLYWLALFAAAKGLLLGGWVLAGLRGGGAGAGAVLVEWLRSAWPLITYASVGTLVTAFDPWFVRYWYAGDEAVFAVFRYGVRELPLVGALTAGLIVAAIPAIARDREAGLRTLRVESRRLFHLLFPLTLLLLVSAGWWWTAVFTDGFSASLPLFRAYLLVVGCRLVFAMSVLTALRYTRWLYLSSLLELAVNALLSWVLAARYGLIGVVWATVIASYLHELVLVAYLRYRGRLGFGRYADGRWYFAYLAGLLAVYLLTEWGTPFFG